MGVAQAGRPCRRSSPPLCASRLRRTHRRARVAVARRTPSAHLRAQLALHPAASPVSPYKARCARRLGPQPCTVWAGRPDCPCFVAFTACLRHASSGRPLRGATSGAPSRSAPGQPLLTCATIVATVVSACGFDSLAALVTFAVAKAVKGVAQARALGAGRQAPPNDDRAVGGPIFAGAKIRRRLPHPSAWPRGRRQDGASAFASAHATPASWLGVVPLRDPVPCGAGIAARHAVAGTMAPLSLRSQMGSTCRQHPDFAGPARWRASTVFRKLGSGK